MRSSRLKKSSATEWMIRCEGRAWCFYQGVFSELSGPALQQFLAKKIHFDLDLQLAPGFLAVPTGVDWQVHLRFPGQETKETLLGGLYAALDGGYDTVLTMPNTRPFLDDPALLRAAIAAAENTIKQAELPIRVFFSAAGTKGMQGIEASDIQALAQAGAVAITDDGWGVKEAQAQEDILRACADSGLVFLQHAETPGHKGVASPSRFQRDNQLNPYPEDAESSMVARDLSILKKVPKARYHVLHVTTEKTVNLVRQAKAEGLAVTAEVSPHHLFFCNEDIPPASDIRSTYFKMNPPLFSKSDQAALRAALSDGTIDFVATDHAPHEREAKQNGWAQAPFGTRGLETALPVLVTLMNQGIVSRERLEQVFSQKPRQIMVPKEKQSEASGFVFVNAREAYTVALADLPGIAENSCFLGTRLWGRVALRIEKDGRLYQT